MQIGPTGVWFSTNGLDRDQLARLAETVEALGYDALWYPESLAYEALALGGFLLSRTSKLKLASGIANIYARDPVSAMMGHNSLNALYGNRFVLGLGVSHVPLVEGRRGHHYGKPVATMRAYLEGMYGAEIAIAAPDRAVVLAALRPRMLALAGELADGALPYNVTPEHTARARETLGADSWLCVEQKICLTNDTEKARAVASEQMSRYMALPNYRNNWLDLGFTEEEIDGRGSDRFLDAMVAWGTADDIRAVIDGHRAAGADHVCIQPFDPEGGNAPDWNALKEFAPA